MIGLKRPIDTRLYSKDSKCPWELLISFCGHIWSYIAQKAVKETTTIRKYCCLCMEKMKHTKVRFRGFILPTLKDEKCHGRSSTMYYRLYALQHKTFWIPELLLVIYQCTLFSIENISPKTLLAERLYKVGSVRRFSKNHTDSTCQNQRNPLVSCYTVSQFAITTKIMW